MIAPSANNNSNTLFVGNLYNLTTKEDVINYFSQWGDVVDVNIAK